MRLLYLILLASLALASQAQTRVIENKQRAFPHDIPPGDYSGITWLGDNRYAVVSDKSPYDGFFVWEIDIDSLSGEIRSARNLGFRSSGLPNRDQEGIAYVAETGRLWIAGEADNRILEYNEDGLHTLRELALPRQLQRLPTNKGLEALTYNPQTHTFWTCNETDSILIQSFSDDLMPHLAYRYLLDQPEGNASHALHYAHGIGTLCALDDGSLLVLEREFFVPKSKLGSFVTCKLYQYTPGQDGKRLLSQWRTTLTLFGRSLANYEGMCLGPTLADGARVILLVADSQHQFGGVLKDWIKSLKLELH